MDALEREGRAASAFDRESLMEAISRGSRPRARSWDDVEGVVGGFDAAEARSASASPSPLRTGRSAEGPLPREGVWEQNDDVTTDPQGGAKRGSALEKLRELFGVPQDEPLVTEYMCALHVKILLQGRMYVFENHVCFYSNVFRSNTNVKIPFEKITLINRAKTALVFPNAIEITQNGRTYFFTSFVFPEKSFKRICRQWAKVSHYGKLNAINTSKSRASFDYGGKDESTLNGVNTSPSDPSDVKASNDSGSESDDGEFVEDDVTTNISSLDDLNDVAADLEDVGDFGNVPTVRVASPTPADPPSFSNVYTGELECTVDEFFLAGFSNKSRQDLQPKMSQALEQTELNVTDWLLKKRIGCVRDMVYVVPVKQSFGPKSTRCHQNQSYCVYEDNTFVLSTSQIQTDIPYGDYFRVEARWVLRPLSKRRCSLSVSTEVIFTKSTMMKGLIVSSVVEESKIIVAKMVEMIMNKINPPKKKPLKKNSSVLEVVDISKLKIPEGSRDVVSKMLTPIKSFVRQSSQQMSVDLTDATPWQKTCILCSRAARVMLLIVVVLILHTAISFTSQSVYGALTRRALGLRFGRDYNEAAYWQAKSRLLNNELLSLERRLAYLTHEIEIARTQLETANGRSGS